MEGTFKLAVIFEGFNRTDNAFANIRKGVEHTKGLFRTLQGEARSIFNLPNMIAGGAMGTALKKFFDAGAGLEQTKISLGVMLKGDDKAVTKLMKEWKDLGAKTNLEDEDIFGVGKMMLSFNAATKDSVTEYARMLADLSGAAENPKEAFKSMGLAFSQVMSTGKLQGNDLLQFVNAGFNPLAEMVKMVREGVSVAGIDTKKLQNKSEKDITEYLYKLKEKGKLSATAVVDAMTHATGKGGLFEHMQDKLSNTGSGKFSTLMSNFKTSVAEASLKAMPVFKDWLDTLIMKVQNLSAWLGRNGDTIKTWISYIPSIVKAVAIWKGLSFSLAFTRGVYGSVVAVQKFVGVYRLMSMAMVAGNIAQQTRLIGLFGDCAKSAGVAIKVKTGLTWLWNSALMANPIVAITAGTIALGVGLYALIKHMRSATSVAEIHSKAQQEARDRMLDEQVSVSLLFEKIKATNPQSKERLSILNELKNQYPDYVQGMDLEKASLSDLEQAYREVTASMEEKMRMEIYTEQLKNEMRSKIEAENLIKDRAQESTTLLGSIKHGLYDVLSHPLGAITGENRYTDYVAKKTEAEGNIDKLKSLMKDLSISRQEHTTKHASSVVVHNNIQVSKTDEQGLRQITNLVGTPKTYEAAPRGAY